MNTAPPLYSKTLIRIEGLVCKVFDVTPEDIRSKSRKASFVLPRHTFMYLARETTKTSLAKIGEHLNFRDHSTVIHGVSSIKDRLFWDKNFKALVDKLVEELGGSNGVNLAIFYLEHAKTSLDAVSYAHLSRHSDNTLYSRILRIKSELASVITDANLTTPTLKNKGVEFNEQS